MSDVRRCPICGRGLPAEDQPARPFCSERCRMVDLGSWLDGRYRVSTAVADAEDEDGPALPAKPDAD